MDHVATLPLPPSTPGRLERWLASPWFWCLLLACGLAVRLRVYLFAHSYWYDESYLILAIRDRGFSQLLGPQPFNLVIPPVFLWLTRALYELGGDGELLMRLPAFVADAASLVVMVPLARKVVGSWHAVWAFAFLLVSRNSLAHAGEVRPYALDLLTAELVLLLAVVLLDPTATGPRRRWSLAGLTMLAAIGPWVSFPSAFMLGGAILALAWAAWSWHGSRSSWVLPGTLAALLLLSGAAYWWLSGRFMYYPGMHDHWGPQGWGGFPDWDHPWAVGKWLLWRPYEIGNYGNRELGLLLTALAVAGGIALARRSGPLTVALTAPLALATAAALVGKYPLAHRCGYFLLPGLWLLAAAGLGDLVQRARRRGWQLAGIGLLLIAWDFTWLVVNFVRPDQRLDYRGAYRLVHAHRQPGDCIWSQAAVVYWTYHAAEPPVLADDAIDEALRLAGRRRLWAVLGDNRHDLRARFEAAGGHVVERYHVSALDVPLFEPAGTAAHNHGP